MLDIRSLWNWAGRRFQSRIIYTNDVTFPRQERCADAATHGAICDVENIITPLDVAFRGVLPRLSLSAPFFLGNSVQLEERSYVSCTNAAVADAFIIGDVSRIDLAYARAVLERHAAKKPCFVLNANRSNSPSLVSDVGRDALELAASAMVSAFLVGKPAWVGFQFILDQLALRPEEVMFITDHATNDAIGSVSCGMPTLQIGRGSYWTNAPVEIVDEILSFIRSPQRRKRNAWE